MRCDEAKPICANCRSVNRQCDYDPVRRFVQVQYTIPQLTGTESEKRAFDFFQACTAGDLTGLWITGFWQRAVLQMSVDYDCIKHAVAAVSSLHEQYVLGSCIRTGRKTLVPHVFALQQYGLSIRQLNESIAVGSCPPEVALVCCVLFVCFEAARSNSIASMTHLRNGISLILSCRNGDFGPRSVSEAEITLEVHRRLLSLIVNTPIDMKSAIEEGIPEATIITQLGEITGRAAQLIDPRGPPTFHSIEDARLQRLTVDNWQLYYYLAANPLYSNKAADHNAYLLNLRKLVLHHMNEYMTAFDEFMKAYGPSMSTRDLRAARYLQCNTDHTRSMCMPMLVPDDRGLTYLEDGSVFDSWLPSFHRTLDSIEQLIDEEEFSIPNTSTTSLSESTRFERKLSPETQYVSMIFTIGRSNSDPGLRRRALDILKRLNMIEGAWDSNACAELLELFIEDQEARARKLATELSDLELNDLSIEKVIKEERDEAWTPQNEDERRRRARETISARPSGMENFENTYISF